ncbi:MAG: efflux RND transporter periplasmic adaptor subunit [Polyangiaceae bacterium]
MKKRVVTWVVGLVALGALVAAGLWWWSRPEAPEIKYETTAVDRGRIASQVTASGTLSALVTVQVGSQVSGRVESLFVDFNSTVKKGDVIAKIDAQTFQAEVQKARANLLAANGNLARTNAEAQLADRQAARVRQLNAEGLSSKIDLDTAESGALAAKGQIEASKGAVEQARAALHQAEINLAYTTIKSPIDGVVISRSVDVGQTVAASLSAPTLFTIAEDLRKMQVDTFVAEADVGKLEAKMATQFTVDAFPTRRFKGTLREIRNAPTTVQNVVTYDAVIDVDNEALALKPGMTANVTIAVSDKADVLRVPNAALRYRPPPEALGSAAASAGASASAAGPGGGRGGGRRGPRPAGPPIAASGAAPGATGGAKAGASADAPVVPNSDAPTPRAGDGDGDEGGGPRPDRKTVWVLDGGKPRSVRIRVGITDGAFTEVLEGELRDGDQVITTSSGGTSPTGSGAPGGNRPGGGSFRRMF